MDLFNIRKDFVLRTLNEEDALANPIEMLLQWLNEAMQAEALEPTAMTLSTATKEGKPSSRVVLLKELREDGLVLFTNYESRKGEQIEQNDAVAVNFMWHELERQVRVEGKVKKLSAAESDEYYDMRPMESKIGAWVSPQSKVIANRAYLDEGVERYEKLYEKEAITRPAQWGGYVIIPGYFEFWQGRKSRLHDRIRYTQEEWAWKIERLAP